MFQGASILTIKPTVAVLAGVLLAAAGCEVGPNYRPPAPSAPQVFDAGPELLPTKLVTTPPTTAAVTSQPTAPKSQSLAAATRAATRPTEGGVDLKHWWTALDDPELNSLVSRAVASNFDIEIATTRVQEVRAQYAAVTGNNWPTIDASGAAAWGTGSNNTKGRVGQPLNAGTNTAGLTEITHVVGFDAAWELDLFGRLRRDQEASRADVQAVAEARDQMFVSVISDLARSYVDLRSYQLRLRITDDNIAALQRTVQLTRIAFQRGIGHELDVVLSERQLSAALARVGPIQAAIRQSQRQIAVLLGLQPQLLYAELDRPSQIPAMAAEVDPGLPLDLVRRRPDVRQKERQLAAETARIGVATANLFPDVGATAGFGMQGQGLGTTPVETKSIWSAGPFFRFPLLDFGRLDALVQVENYRTRELLLAYRKSVISAVQEVEDALTNYGAERNRFDQLTVAVASSQQAVNLATERYQRGLAEFLNVLDAQRQLYDLQDQLAASQQVVSTQLIALFKALGGGWEGFAELPPPVRPQPAIFAAGRELAHRDKSDAQP